MSSFQWNDQPSSRPRSIRAPFQNIDCQSLVALPRASSGWLRILDKSKKWTQKFTVIYSGYVYLFKRESCASPKDFFSLYGYTSVERATEMETRDRYWVIKIVPASDITNTPKYFALSSEADLNIWTDRFFEEMQMANDHEYVQRVYEDMNYSSRHNATSLSSGHRGGSELSRKSEVGIYNEKGSKKFSAPAFLTNRALPPPPSPLAITPEQNQATQSVRCKEVINYVEPVTEKFGPYVLRVAVSGNTCKPAVENETHCAIGNSLSWEHSSSDTKEHEEEHDPFTEYTDAVSESTESLYDKIRHVSRRKSRSFTSENLIPQELLAKNKKSVEIYNAFLKSVREKRNKVRIHVVGPRKSGKTCLVMRLLGKDIRDVKSTNGVEMHFLKCKAKTGDMKSICHEESSVEEDVKSRLLKSLIITYKDTNGNKISDTYENIKDREDDDDSSLENVESPGKPDKWTIPYFNKSTDDGQIAEYENFSEDLHDLCEILKAPFDPEDIATIDLGDFAGAKEYHNTHKVFLSKNAIYIVTVDVSEYPQDVSLEKFSCDLKFWLETINCLGTDTSSDEDTQHKVPSVFIVGTHKDKFKGTLQQFEIGVSKAVGNEKTMKYVKNYYLVSNTDETDEDFRNLLEEILQTAQINSFWTESRPVRWIHLEKSLLEEIKSGVFILSKQEILFIAAKSNQPIYDPEEVEAFLLYHHGIGTYIYFKDLPDFVVLYPQWLADALRCIVSADMFQVDLSIKTEWDQFRQTGRLKKELADYLFSRTPSVIKENNDHIIQVMEKFDILVRPKIKLSPKQIYQELNYFVPCMRRTKDLHEVDLFFNCKSKSSWLCLEFEFLPPSLVTSLLVAYSRELTLVSIWNSNTSDNELVLYSNFALFYLKDAEKDMLLIAAHNNIIQIQIWKWEVQKRSYSGLRKELDVFLRRISRVFQMNLSYETKLKCSTCKFHCCVGMEDIQNFEHGKKYFCKMHNGLHSTEELFVEWIRSELQQNLSKAQINATRISILTHGVLTDALYDRLSLDSTHIPQRGDCDIDYLYTELRRRNHHMPTKGDWGGKLKDVKGTEKKIGDDIERIRLIQNEVQHLTPFAIDNSRFKELSRLIRTVAKRMELNNKKGTEYTDEIMDVLQRDINIKQVEEQKQRMQIGGAMKI